MYTMDTSANCLRNEIYFIVITQIALINSRLMRDSQYGFRKKHYTGMALTDTVEFIKDALDNKLYAICILIDLQTAFDTIKPQYFN